MKIALSAALILFAVSAHAEPGGEAPQAPKNRPPNQGGREKLRPLEFWKQADINDDQQLSKDEFIQLPRISPLTPEKQDKLFSHLDKNDNNTLEPAEMIPGPGNTGTGSPEDPKVRPHMRLAEMDKNGDKKIEFTEFLQSPFIAKLPVDRQKKMFAIMDRNSDGLLSPEDGPPPGTKLPPEGDRKNPPMFNAQRLFPMLDSNKDGVLDFAEFQDAPFAKGRGEDAQEDLFEAIDTDDDLKIDPREMQQHGETNKSNPKKEQQSPREKPQTPKQTDPQQEEAKMMEEGA